MKKMRLFQIMCAILTVQGLGAAELLPSDIEAGMGFGGSVSQFGGLVVVGAEYDNSATYMDQGSAYLYRNVLNADVSFTENAKLTASDGDGRDYFGRSVSIDGTTAIVGAYGARVNAKDFQGAVYVFHNLNSASGPLTEDAKLIASDGGTSDYFGGSTDMQAGMGLVGASQNKIGTNNAQGAAYLYRNLETASGIVTESAKLVASDGLAYARLGEEVALSGYTGLVFASQAGAPAVYVYRNLDQASGVIYENAKLIASNGSDDENFGQSVALDGTLGLVGASGAGFEKFGSVYLYKNLDTIEGSVTETARLLASDSFYLGGSIGISGTDAVVGSSTGVYFYRDLDSAVGSVYERLKMVASDSDGNDNFGASVALYGDQFLIGANVANKVYTGSLSSVTTLDLGDAVASIEGVSFWSYDDWVIGQGTDGNQVILREGNFANIGSDKSVFVGMNAGSDANTLVIAGSISATDVFIGSIAGNSGNVFQLDETATLSITSIHLAHGNSLRIFGDYSIIDGIFTYLGATELNVWADTQWLLVDGGNADDWLVSTYDEESGYTTLQTVPEPTIACLSAFSLFFLFASRRFARMTQRLGKLA